MNINLPYDYSSNISDVNLILVNNSLKEIGNITNFNDFEVVLNYNSYNEISFNVYKELNSKKTTYWDKIKSLGVVYVEEINEHFKIFVTIDDSNEIIKHVSGISLCADELSNIKLYNIEINTSSDIAREDYTIPTVFYSDNKASSLLHRILDKAPHYSIGHVDDSLKKIQRVFEFNETSVYDALTSISERVGCIYKYDTSTRTINAYDLKNYCVDCGHRFEEKTAICPKCDSTNIVFGNGNETCISISKDNLATIVSMDSDEDSYKNCLRLKTGDEMIDATIRNINPNGSEYIYYFNEDVLCDMPDELIDKITQYNDLNSYYQNEYVLQLKNDDLKLKYNTLVAKYNSDQYKKYDYDDEGNRKLVNNDFVQIDSSIKGYDNFAKLIYDNIDFSLYIEHSLLPSVLEEDVTIDDDIANLNEENLNNFALSELKQSTSQSTIETFLKKYAGLYMKNSYLTTINTTSYDYEGERNDGWHYANWEGTITISKYGDSEITRTTPLLRLALSDNYEQFLKLKIELNLKSSDDELGGIYNIMSIESDEDFKNALKQYSLTRLNSFSDAYEGGLNVLIEADQASDSADFYNDIYVPLYQRTQFISEEIKLRVSELETIEEVSLVLDSIKKEIQNTLNFESFVGTELWRILKTYIREDVFTNDNITSEGMSNTEVISLAREVVENAENEIKSIGYLQKTITTSLMNFLSLKEFESYLSDFNVGNWISTEIDDVIYRLRLISISVIISDDVQISVELSQVINKGNELSDVKSVLNQASSITSSFGEIKNAVEQSSNTSTVISDWLQNGLDLTNQEIISDKNKKDVVFGKNGILVRSYDQINEEYEPTQLKILESTLAITDDNWKTVKTAIGKFYYTDPITGEKKIGYGINSEVLVGSLIIGEELTIKTSDNSFKMDSNGLLINTTPSDGVYKNLFTIQKNGVNKMYINDNGDIVANDLYVTNGTFSGEVNALSGVIAGWTIVDNTMTSEYLNTSTNVKSIALIDAQNNIIKFIKQEKLSNGSYGNSTVTCFTNEGIELQKGHTTQGGRYEYSGMYLKGDKLQFIGNMDTASGEISNYGATFSDASMKTDTHYGSGGITFTELGEYAFISYSSGTLTIQSPARISIVAPSVTINGKSY